MTHVGEGTMRAAKRGEAGTFGMISLGLVIASGCSFTSVATTGSTGAWLADYEHAFDYSAEFCRLLGEPADDQPRCEDLDADSETWRRVFGVLSAYGAMLEASAARTKVEAIPLFAVTLRIVDDDFDELDDDAQEQVATALAALVDLLTQELRRKQIRATLDQAQALVSTVVTRARANVEISLINLCIIDGAAEIAARTWGAGKCVDGEPGCVQKSAGARMSLEHVRATAKQERSLLLELDAALASFAVAHAELWANSDKIGRTADNQLDASIKVDIEAAVEASETKLAQYEDCESSATPGFGDTNDAK
jgi:hypothetical protein